MSGSWYLLFGYFFFLIFHRTTLQYYYCCYYTVTTKRQTDLWFRLGTIFFFADASAPYNNNYYYHYRGINMTARFRRWDTFLYIFFLSRTLYHINTIQLAAIDLRRRGRTQKIPLSLRSSIINCVRFTTRPETYVTIITTVPRVIYVVFVCLRNEKKMWHRSSEFHNTPRLTFLIFKSS